MSAIADHHLALSKAKINLMSRLDSAFFTSICFSLKHYWDDKVPTACTDGVSIWFNIKFFMKLTVEEQVFLLLHETLHAAYMHMARLMGRDPQIWNYAADYVINLQLVDRGFKMPACGLLDRRFAGMSVDQVYKILVQENPKIDPKLMDLKPGDKKSDDQLSQDMQDILVRAAVQSAMFGDKPGTIPGDIQIFLNGLLKPKLPWNRLLQKYLTQFDKNDYSFRKPNRRFFPQHYLPSLQGEKLMNLAIGVDISGSVSNSDFHRFVSEIASIFRMMKPEKITLIQFDTKITSIEEVKSLGELMKVKFSGRGGTAIAPLMNWANTNKPQLLMIFTDGQFRFGDAATTITTFWLIHNNSLFAAPFGQVIHYKM